MDMCHIGNLTRLNFKIHHYITFLPIIIRCQMCGIAIESKAVIIYDEGDMSDELGNCLCDILTLCAVSYTS